MSKKQTIPENVKKQTKSVLINEQPWFIKFAIPLIALVIVMVYGQSLSLGYTYLDDSIFILDKGTENEKIGNIINAFFQGTFGEKDIYYRPLFRISFILERQFLFLFPIESFAVIAIKLAHFIEVILHIICVCLLYKLLQKFSISKTNAFFWSLVFAVHPVLTMAVVWIPGRNDLMLSIFLFSFFIHFIDYLNTNNRRHLIWQFVFLLLALFTKETAVFIPFAAVLYLIVFRRNNLFKNNLLFIYSVWLAELVAWYFLRNNILDKTHSSIPLNETIDTLSERIPGLLQYIGKIYLPFNLTVYPTIADTTYVFGIIAALILIVLVWLNKNRNMKMIYFGLGWFVLFILPFFFVPKKINDALYEHRLYAPLFGMILITIEALPSLIKIAASWFKQIAAVIIILFSVMTFQYTRHFMDEITFYSKAAADSPSSAYAVKMLGIRLVYKEREAEAIPLFKKAFELDTTQMYTRYFLSKLIYLKQDSLVKAKQLLLAEIKLTPTFAENYFDLAFIAYKENDFESLIFYLKKVVEIQPKDQMVNNNLLKAYVDTRNKKEAMNQIDYMRSRGIQIDEAIINQVNKIVE